MEGCGRGVGRLYGLEVWCWDGIFEGLDAEILLILASLFLELWDGMEEH